jgi:stage V sporulation protein SpoVS
MTEEFYFILKEQKKCITAVGASEVNQAVYKPVKNPQ